jgi:hypothetical protein
MNSSMPSILDAIFGKKDLASVSVDEMIEVINEFPSFNAAHFLLSKKLRQENDLTFEKVSMRTALYFNNPLWLETLLTEENRPAIIPEKDTKVSEEKNEYPQNETEPEQFEEYQEVIQVAGETIGVKEDEFPLNEVLPDTDVIFVENTIPLEEIQAAKESLPAHEDESTQAEKFSGTVSSFDELFLKYQIEVSEPDVVSPDDSITGKETTTQTILVEPEEEKFETRDEILNEYGIFEEDLVKEADQDLEAFDRPVEMKSSVPEEVVIGHPATEPQPAEIENLTESQTSGKSSEKSDEGDYESFDKPIDIKEPEELPAEIVNSATITAESLELDAELLEAEADDTDAKGFSDETQEPVVDEEMQELVSRFAEKQKSMPLFDAKKAESIVFTPYHMIDYFASQGIKLVLEDQPADNFGKQLKSFTDWLKVMKKLPHQQVPEKQNEKETETIRHFAAHSIEERDILTEAMAEVLAKQGMYENAIALFQKLSLIYPPKSAYFASRIEQLKASLP